MNMNMGFIEQMPSKQQEKEIHKWYNACFLFSIMQMPWRYHGTVSRLSQRGQLWWRGSFRVRVPGFEPRRATGFWRKPALRLVRARTNSLRFSPVSSLRQRQGSHVCRLLKVMSLIKANFEWQWRRNLNKRFGDFDLHKRRKGLSIFPARMYTSKPHAPKLSI